MKKYSIFTALLFSLFIGACNTTQPEPTPIKQVQPFNTKVFEQLYLRGSFSLWDYDESYKLQQVSRNLYSAAASLQRSQTYEFMFSGKDTTKPYANCGYHQDKDQVVIEKKKVRARCTNVVLQNFKFTPKKSGMYEFFIDVSYIQFPRVYVNKAY